MFSLRLPDFEKVFFFGQGAGSALLMRPTRMEQCVRATSASIDTPLTIKVQFNAINFVPSLVEISVSDYFTPLR